MNQTIQPRHQAGARRSGEPAGGRWATKTVPTIKASSLGFHNTAAGIGPPNDWTELDVVLFCDTKTRFQRTVETDANGDQVVSVVSDCDPPDVLLLARKGDAVYWSGDNWTKHGHDRRTWAAGIAVNMLQEGLIATGYDQSGYDNVGVPAAMYAAASTDDRAYDIHHVQHVLTKCVAQLRGLRLIESMRPPDARDTTLGKYAIPADTRTLLASCFYDTYDMYGRLPRPPWDNSGGVPWGPQPIAGHAVDAGGYDIFVGEHGDLLWRALTETAASGLSPIKEAFGRFGSPLMSDMVCAAALYDETAEKQLTTGLFDGVEPENRGFLQTNLFRVFNQQLNLDPDKCRWTVEQQDRIAGFINVIDGLEA